MARSLWKELFQPSIVLHRLSLSSPPLHTRIKSLLNFKPNIGKYSYKTPNLNILQISCGVFSLRFLNIFNINIITVCASISKLYSVYIYIYINCTAVYYSAGLPLFLPADCNQRQINPPPPLSAAARVFHTRETKEIFISCDR